MCARETVCASMCKLSKKVHMFKARFVCACLCECVRRLCFMCEGDHMLSGSISSPSLLSCLPGAEQQ